MSRPPAQIAALLRQPELSLLARVVLTAPFWMSAALKTLDWPGAVAEMMHFGLSPAPLFALLVIIVQATGSLGVILGRWSWLAAGTLSVFTVLATSLAHPFWTMQGAQQIAELNHALANFAIVAGLALAVILADGRRAP